MAAPKVQTLAEVMADLNPAYAQQETLINTQRGGLAAKYGAQKDAITAEKGQGFNVINNQATGRGGSFSGIPVEEQATYLSTKFLPGMQKADADMNLEDVGLQQEAAKILTDKTKTAMGTIEGQKKDLNSWNMQVMQQEASAREAALNRAHTSSENAKSRSATAAANAPKQVSPSTAAFSIISATLGRDGFVSPGTFQLARDAYKMAGGSPQQFASEFWKYTGTNKGQPNQSNWKSYYYG